MIFTAWQAHAPDGGLCKVEKLFSLRAQSTHLGRVYKVRGEVVLLRTRSTLPTGVRQVRRGVFAAHGQPLAWVCKVRRIIFIARAVNAPRRGLE
jgi:hypothetical protein